MNNNYEVNKMTAFEILLIGFFFTAIIRAAIGEHDMLQDERELAAINHARTRAAAARVAATSTSRTNARTVTTRRNTNANYDVRVVSGKPNWEKSSNSHHTPQYRRISNSATPLTRHPYKPAAQIKPSSSFTSCKNEKMFEVA